MGLSLGCTRAQKHENWQHQSSNSDQISSVNDPTVTFERREVSANPLLPLMNEKFTTIRKNMKKETLSQLLFDNFLPFVRNYSWMEKVQELSADVGNYSNTGGKQGMKSLILSEHNINLTLQLQVHTQTHNVLCCFPRSQRLSVIIGCLWSIFSLEPAYQEFLFSEQDEKRSQVSTLSGVHSSEHSSHLSQGVHENDSALVRAFCKEIDRAEDTKLCSRVCSGHWIERALRAFDACIVGLHIARVEKGTGRFPLIFVNKAYAEGLFLTQEQLLGTDLAALLAHWGEVDQTAGVVQAIRCGRREEAYVTSSSAGPLKLLNFVKVEPLYSETGDYRLVLGVQLDVSALGWDGEALKSLDDLFWILRCFL